MFRFFQSADVNRPNRAEFFGGLESLRGIAALLVVFYHMKDASFGNNPFISSRFVGNGYLMVDLFFVLSGFVIFHSYGKKIKSGRDIIQFIFLRFGRLYPLHLATLLLFLGVEYAKYVSETRYGMVPNQTAAFSFSNTPAFIMNLFLIHPFFQFSNLTFNHPSWSIGTEFYTYILFSITVLFAVNRQSLRFLSATIMAMAIGGLMFFHSYYLCPDAFICFLRCVMGFFIGVLAYDFFLDANWIRRHGAVISLGCLGLLALILCCKPGQCPGWDYSVLPCYALLIVAVADSTSGIIAKILNFRVTRWIGRISYSLYMCHLFVVMIVSRLFSPVEHIADKFVKSPAMIHHINVLLMFSFILVTVLLALFVSQLSYSWIERPFQNKFREWSKDLFPAGEQRLGTQS